MDGITAKTIKYNSPHRRNVALAKETPQGIAIEVGVVDVNVNPEYISKCILVEIEESIAGEVVQTTAERGKIC